MKGEPSTPFFWAVLAGIMLWAWSVLPHIDHPLGSDWGHYFTAAEYIWDPREGLAYPDFRKPWYGWIIGGLGQFFGYFAAAQWLGRISMLCMVGGAALLGTAMAGRWLGLVAAATIPLMPLVMDGSLWVNHYPVLGATVGLAIGAGAAASRWRHWGWALLAGVLAGVSLALDLRGSVTVPMVLALVLLSGLSLGFRRMAVHLVLMAIGLGSVQLHDHWLQDRFDVPQLEFERQLQVQRSGTLEQIQQGIFEDEALQAACAGELVGPITAQSLLSECSDRLLKSGHTRLFQLGLVPSLNTLWWLPLALIPLAGTRREQLKTSLMSVIVFVVPLVSLWVGMRWVTYFDRYVLPFAVVYACVLPVAMGRMASVLGVLFARMTPVWVWLAASLSLGAAVGVWPGLGARALDSPETVRSSEYHAGILAAWALETVASGESVIDCAGLAIDSLLLPTKIDYVRYPPGDASCVALIREPGTTNRTSYLITMHRDLPPQFRITDLPFNAVAIEALGWRPLTVDLPVDGYRIWSR